MGYNHNPHVSKPGPARWTTRFAPGHGHLVADAVSVVIIRAFLGLRDGTMDRLRVAAFKDEVAYIGRSKLRLAIKLAAEAGWTFGKLWDEHDWSAPRLGREVEEMRIRGYIPQQALFVPHYVYQRRKSERTLMEEHAEDERQMKLGLH